MLCSAVLPARVGLKSAGYDATSTTILAEFFRHTLTVCPPDFNPPPEDRDVPFPLGPHPHSLLARVRRRLLSLYNPSCFPRVFRPEFPFDALFGFDWPRSVESF